MRKMGFSNLWISRVMLCVSLVSYLVLINRVSSSYFQPGRGIRQGDSISPYLSLLCVERLSSLINLAKSSNKVFGFRVARVSIPITDLFFADDFMLFCKSKLTEWLAIQSVLNIYETTPGQCLNRHKSSIFFSVNTKSNIKIQLTNLSNIQSCNNQDKYLDLPIYVGKAKYKNFKLIKDRVWARLDNWKDNHIFHVGK